MNKWYYVVLAIFFIGMFGSLSYTEHAKKECRIEMVKAGKSIDDVIKLCGK